MKPTNKYLATILITAGLAGATFAAQAKQAQVKDAIAASEARVTLLKATHLALQKVPGTAVRVKFEDKDGQTFWAVEIVASNQKVRDLRVDATTGRVLNDLSLEGTSDMN